MRTSRFSFILSRLFICLFTASVLAAAAHAQADPPRCKDLKDLKTGVRIATGPKGGSYIRIGEVLQRYTQDMKLVPCTTDGSFENLQLLSAQEVEFALVQGDLVHSGWEGEPPPEYMEEKDRTDSQRKKIDCSDRSKLTPKELWQCISFPEIKLVRWLYSERLQIIAGPHSYILSLDDLKHKSVWIGPKGSGDYTTAQEVLKAAGIFFDTKANPLLTSPSDFAGANQELADGKIAAIFRTTSVPIDSNRELHPDNNDLTLTDLFDRKPETHLVGLEQPILDRLLQNPCYVQVPIYRGTYPNQNQGVLTIAIEAMLLTRSSEDNERVRSLGSALTGNRSDIERQINVQLDLLDKKLAPKSRGHADPLTAHVHDAMLRQLTPTARDRYLSSAFFVCGLLLLAAFAWSSKKALMLLGRGSKYLFAGGLLGIFSIGFGIAVWLIERKFSLQFQNPISAAKALLIYFARGLKSDAVTTSNGQLMALFALAVIATVIHWLHSEALNDSVDAISLRLRRFFYSRADALKPGERRLVVVNWNQRAADKLAEWTAGSGKNRATVHVIVQPDADHPDESDSVKIFVGDPRSPKLLASARAGQAAHVLICSSWSRVNPANRRRLMDPELADSYSIRAIQSIRAVQQSDGRTDVPLQVEILVERNDEDARLAGGPATEVIRAPRHVNHASVSMPAGAVPHPAPAD